MEQVQVKPEMVKVTVGDYSCRMTGMNKEDDNEVIYLKIEALPKMHELLKEIACPEDGLKEFLYKSGGDGSSPSTPLKRYKAKEWFIRSIGSEYGARDLLFLPDLIKSGKVMVKFFDYQALDDCKDSIKKILKYLVEGWLSYNHLDLTVTVKVK